MPYSTMASPTNRSSSQPQAGPIGSSSNSSNDTSYYHALIIDSGAIIKQTSLSTTTSLLNSAKHYYTVPAVLSEIRDAKSRKHLEEFQLRLQSLHDTSLQTRTPSQAAIAAMSEFARKTGDYSQLSGVDLQVLALLYDLEVEAANVYNDGKLDHVRTEPKRVLGVHVKALTGDGKREIVRRERGGSVASSDVGSDSIMSGTSFFRGNADGIIDAANVDLEYDNDGEGEDDIVYSSNGVISVDEEREDSVSNSNLATNGSGNAPSSWAKLVNPQRASTGPLVNYTLDTSEGKPEEKEQSQEVPTLEMGLKGGTHDPVEGQFDDASEDDDEEGEDAFSNSSDSDGELEAINIANAASDDELSDEECDTFILEPHEAAYYNKLREKKAMHNDDDGIESEFPSLAAAATVPYEGSDDEAGEEEEDIDSQLAWKKEEEERKKKSLQPMVNGRVINSNKQASYNSFRKYGNVVSTDGSAVAMKKQKEQSTINDNGAPPEPLESFGNDVEIDSNENAANQEYKSRILGAAGASANDFPSEMTADDDDGEGWVTSTRDIQTMKATGSLHLAPSRHSNKASAKAPRKDVGPPISQRAACATTDFAMQNVILQMNLELLSVDGVRVRRLKTWVTRCGACFTIYGHDDKKKGGGRLFCDKCGSNALQRIAASVDRNTGRLKLHMRKNYQYNTRGTKFSLPKAGKGNKYEGDLLLAEDQLMYGAWNQKVRKGKSKTSGQSIFGSDLASDLGCHADLTKRDDIKVGFGRRNPNSTKFGRERRGKKKKGNTKDKACGLRRY